MKLRLIADENVSHRMVSACLRLQSGFPIAHIADWRDGACLQMKDTALLLALREENLVLVSFDRSSLAHHAGQLTREGLGHSGVILFRRAVPQAAYGAQARLLVECWRKHSTADWTDTVVYLPAA